MPLISIIIPVYNAQDWLKPCIESIIHQSYTNIEIILVNDGSTDNSGTILDNYARQDSRITVKDKPNGGPSAARNLGIDIARGEYLIFVDADDELHPDMVRHLYAVHQQTNADICCGCTVYKQSYTFKPFSHERINVIDSATAIERTLYQQPNYYPSAWNTLYRKELFNGLRFAEGLRYEDLDFFYKIFIRANKIGYTNQITYFYRENRASYINTWSNARLDVLYVVDNLLQYMQANGGPNLQRAARDRRFSAYYNMFVLATQHGEYSTANRCWPTIKQNRLSEIFNPKVRIKNKAGAIVALFGKQFATMIVKAIAGLHRSRG